jgi:hypothetical protein
MIVFEPTFTGVGYPLNHPRIGARPVSGTVAGSTQAAGFDAAFAANANTAQWWRPTAVPATWTLTFTSAPISYFGIASHNCGTVGATIEYQTWDGAAWVTRATHSPTDDTAIFGLVRRRTQDRARLRFTGAIPTIGVIYFGDVLEFPRKASYTGSTAYNRATQDEYSTPISDGGQFLGRYVTRRSMPAMLKVEHLSEAWADTYLYPVIEDMKARPVFMADRPSQFPASVAFGYSTGPIIPERRIPNSAVSLGVDFELVGHVA